MRKHVSQREYSMKVTDAALFCIDAIKMKRVKGLIHDNEISVRLGCAAQTIHYWRKGERAITLDQLGALIKEFDLNTNFLMKQEGSIWGEAELFMGLRNLEERLNIVEDKLGIKPVKKGKQK